MFNQFAQESHAIATFGIKIKQVTLPPVLGTVQKRQNYDQSFSQQIIYGEVARKITTIGKGIFAGNETPPTLYSNGLLQTVDPGRHEVLARFEDENPQLSG
jgi:hypothetical protein